MCDSTQQNDFEVPAYDAQAIEAKWQKAWEEEGLYKTDEDPSKPKKYVLEMFPYPSGDLHMGHARNYTIGDAMARQARMRGYDVLHPMGFDAFGLPAENAAIKHHTQAAKWTYQNIANAVHTMKRMGFSYDYDRMFNTCDPEYYRWGQWTFIEMWKRGLAYRATSPVNWCPTCKTVLANEQVVEGRCWRCGSIPEKRELSQWYLKITDYAQELLDDLDKLTGWPENVKAQQRNWIGRSEGAEIDFKLAAEDGVTPTDRTISVFTTRADTIFGVSFMVLPPESDLAAELVKGTQYEADYLRLKEATEKVSSVDRQGSAREKHGVFTGRYVINSVTGKPAPLWVADYVLLDYGTGAVMGVPCGDQRDFDFARKYGLPIPPIICQKEDPLYDELKDERELRVTNVDWDQAMAAEGYLVQSGQFTGMKGGKHSEAVDAIVGWLEEHGCGRTKVQFRLRDWLISRQRYWGNPIPMVHCDCCGDVPVPEDQLPVRLPDNLDLGAGDTLAECPEFYETTCPKCGKPAKRITDTMDTFTCSSWYYLRYTDPHNDKAPFSKEAVDRWMPVDNYIGGIEHAILHLLYSRFWTKVLRDMGMVDVDEPFTNLLCQGMVKDENGDTMSKSKGNVVPPSSVIDPYGADTMRLAILFVAPPEKDFDWDPEAVAGANRFIKRAWRVVWLLSHGAKRGEVDASKLSGADAELNRALHELGIKCTNDFDRSQFNTAISASMELVNAASKYVNDVPEDKRDAALAWRVAHDIVTMLAPICPHWAEELFHEALGLSGSVYNEPWPKFDAEQAKSDMVEIAVQIKGKVRARIQVAADASKEELESAAREAVAEQIAGKTVKKVVVVPGRLVNIVAI
ncbi:MAG: leucine--tRNA ligase [Olsenella sp.]|jgi:leucyl-tRNA synthetase|nr:leucine--tRNA ligase [Olsenella sp.]